MTKKERQKIIQAIDYFLDSDPDKWVDGIDILFLLIYGKRWSDYLQKGKGINIFKLLKKLDTESLTLSATILNNVKDCSR